MRRLLRSARLVILGAAVLTLGGVAPAAALDDERADGHRRIGARAREEVVLWTSTQSASTFVCPVAGMFRDDWGERRSGGRGHAGTDVFAPTGTPVVAVVAGSLTQQWGGGGGRSAFLAAPDGTTYFYAHLSAYAGDARDVAQGELIGYVGSTGNATAPHLHFEMRAPGGPENPFPTLWATC